MAGIFALFFGGYLLAANLTKSIKNDIESDAMRKCAKNTNKEIYYDKNGFPHWTQTDEIVEINKLGNGTKITGIKTKTIYKNEVSKKCKIRENENAKLMAGIKYCKENGIKYFPYYFPNSLSRRKCWDNTGIEVETGKKYCCYEYGGEYKWRNNKLELIPNYRLIYLEDNPHRAWHERGGLFFEYDAIHTGEGSKIENLKDFSTEKSNNADGKDSFYYTKVYNISAEEAKLRTTELEKFPYNYYTLR